MKLTLEHIAPYLSYGLKVLHSGKQKKMNAAQGSSVNWIGISSVIRWGNSIAEKPMPILRPLSDLTREIEVNGERFVPIVELAKIVFPEFDWESNDICAFNLSELNRYFEFDIGSFKFWTRFGEHFVPNQYKLFQKLAEWHFDFAFNLIESGVAVDINQIEK